MTDRPSGSATEDYWDAHAVWGSVELTVRPAYDSPATVALSPDKARLLALRLIKSADAAEDLP